MAGLALVAKIEWGWGLGVLALVGFVTVHITVALMCTGERLRSLKSHGRAIAVDPNSHVAVELFAVRCVSVCNVLTCSSSQSYVIVHVRGSNHLPTIHTYKAHTVCCKDRRVRQRTVAWELTNGSSRSTERTLWQGLVNPSGRAAFRWADLDPSNQALAVITYLP